MSHILIVCLANGWTMMVWYTVGVVCIETENLNRGAVMAQEGIKNSGRAGEWLERLNRSHHALWLLFVISFLETIIIPIPIELVLIPFMLTNQDRIWQTATYVTAGCLAASLLGYGTGYFMFETAGEWAIHNLGWEQGYQKFQTLFEDHGFYAILALGIVPVPFQTAMLTAGAAEYPVWKFALAATIARGIRYYGMAFLVDAFGDKARALWERHKLLAAVVILAIIGIIWALTQWASSYII